MERVSVDFPVALDRGLPSTIPGQIAAAVRAAVAAGTLQAGDRMPSSRALAQRLGVSRGSVSAAYDQLHAETYLTSRPRSGVRVNPGLRYAGSEVARGPEVAGGTEVAGGSKPEPEPAAGPPGDVVDLRPGRDSTSTLTDGAWRSALRRAAHEGGAPSEPDPAGLPALRSAIATHLRLMRGMSIDPQRVVITAGAREGLTVLLAALRGRDDRLLRVGVEEPGFPGLRRALQRQRVGLVPLGVDDAGVRPDGAAEGLDALIVTPNHQFPRGSAMPATRRAELLEWARSTRTLLVEDDYDSELRYLGPPLPALYDLGTEQVVHLGTFARVLTRDVGTGYLVLPSRLVPAVREARVDVGPPVAPILQRAIAAYLDDGGLRRHIQRGRARLARAARLVARAGLPGAVDAGGVLVIETAAAERDRLIAAAAERGVLLGDRAEGWSGPSDRHGVVAAYDGLELASVARALEVLAEVL